MHLKPADGRAPRDPQTGMRIPATGQSVSEHDPHWAILRRDGDVVECEPPPAPEPVPPAHGAAKTLADVLAASAARSEAIARDDAVPVGDQAPVDAATPVEEH